MSTQPVKPLFRTSPFLDLLGGFSYRDLDDGFAVGVTVAPSHLNAKGTAHGGLIATLADVSLGYVTALSETPPLSMLTTSLTLNFIAAARVGDYLESTVRVVRKGKRLAFADATLTVNDAVVATAHAVFNVIDRSAARPADVRDGG